MKVNVTTIEAPAKYDPEVAIRNLAYGAVMGYLLGPKIGIPSGFAEPVGALVAGAIDRGIFWLKGRLKIRRGK
jgi:hypothetical protein